ncbi:hypothetical protein [Desulfosporosinus acididurans]|uniref:hypothetical protein n=1 Tax=Desulfosporosinus acididurans TaxID=476652 RepID=UPI00128E08E1|nr:hypothetical protein [Desulfosporosinus acididurans]
MKTTKGESTDAHEGDGTSCSSDEALVMRVEQRGCISLKEVLVNREIGRSFQLSASACSRKASRERLVRAV